MSNVSPKPPIRGAARVSAAYEELLSRFIRWAEKEENVRAAVVIGSRARTDHPADEWADLDVVIIARDPEVYWRDPTWIENVGPHRLTFVEDAASGVGRELRVLFEGGLDVDFAPVPVDLLRAMLASGNTDALRLAVGRGMKVLLDREQLTGPLLSLVGSHAEYRPPTAAQYANLVGDFWYHAVWSAKHLRRGELWWAKLSVDGHLKDLLRQMLEWHARARNGSGQDTWFRGRFFEEWADGRALAELRGAFASYDEPDVWRALRETVRLFRWVAEETARRLGYVYPASADQQATEIVTSLEESIE